VQAAAAGAALGAAAAAAAAKQVRMENQGVGANAIIAREVVRLSRIATDGRIEVLNVNPRHKKAIILLLYQNSIKVLKDALAHLGQYQTLTEVWYIDPGGENTVPLPAIIQI
jgi:hypothetical protein